MEPQFILLIAYFVVMFAIIICTVVGMWKAFEKAGEPGIACIVPIWNILVICKIAGKPAWWVLLFFIPCVSFVVAILINLAVAKNYGKSELFGIGMAFIPMVFWPILGFGDARYVGYKG